MVDDLTVFMTAVAVVSAALVYVALRAVRLVEQGSEINPERAAQGVTEACAYIKPVNRARRFPVVSLDNVNQLRGEFGLLRDSATLIEPRTHRFTIGAGTRLRLGKFPLYLGGAQSTPVESLRPVATGELYLSNRRLIFLSERRSAIVALKEVAAVEGGPDSITVHAAERARPLVLALSNAATWTLMIKLAVSSPIASPGLPDGLNLRAEPTGKPGEVELTAERAAPGLAVHPG